MRTATAIHRELAARALSEINRLALLGPPEMLRVLPHSGNFQEAVPRSVPNSQIVSEKKEEKVIAEKVTAPKVTTPKAKAAPKSKTPKA